MQAKAWSTPELKKEINKETGIKYNEKTKTTEVGGNLYVDGTITGSEVRYVPLHSYPVIPSELSSTEFSILINNDKIDLIRGIHIFSQNRTYHLFVYVTWSGKYYNIYCILDNEIELPVTTASINSGGSSSFDIDTASASTQILAQDFDGGEALFYEIDAPINIEI